MSFEKLFELEQQLAVFTGAPYVVVTDGCTNAIELCLRYDQVKECKFTPYTYLSIPMTMHKLGIDYEYLDHAWQRWAGEYPFLGTRVWDSARRLERNMYRLGQLQCLSFGHGKPLTVGKLGAILLDDAKAYAWLSCARSDGRDLRIKPWQDQPVFNPGYHYCPTLETCEQALSLLPTVKEQCQEVLYPDCRKLVIQG